MTALAMKLANWGAMMRNAPTQVRTQPIVVTVLPASTGPTSLAIVSDFCIGVSCPFAGMTRIRFKGFFSAQKRAPSEQCLMYARGQDCQCGAGERECAFRSLASAIWVVTMRTQR